MPGLLRLGVARHHAYFGSTCVTFLNGNKIYPEDEGNTLSHRDMASLGPCHTNIYLLFVKEPDEEWIGRSLESLVDASSNTEVKEDQELETPPHGTDDGSWLEAAQVPPWVFRKFCKIGWGLSPILRCPVWGPEGCPWLRADWPSN